MVAQKQFLIGSSGSSISQDGTPFKRLIPKLERDIFKECPEHPCMSGDVPGPLIQQVLPWKLAGFFSRWSTASLVGLKLVFFRGLLLLVGRPGLANLADASVAARFAELLKPYDVLLLHSCCLLQNDWVVVTQIGYSSTGDWMSWMKCEIKQINASNLIPG